MADDGPSSQHGHTLSAAPIRNNSSVATKLASVLSTSYSDAEFREALDLLDQRQIVNDGRGRRQIRLNLQKDVLDCNEVIVNEFGRVAEVSLCIRYMH